MAALDRSDEKLLVRCASAVQRNLVNGMEPNAAITKVAQEHNVHPDMLPLLVQACNVGIQTQQREKASSILDLISEYDLADVDQVKAALYPKKAATVKAASASANGLLEMKHDPALNCAIKRADYQSPRCARIVPISDSDLRKQVTKFAEWIKRDTETLRHAEQQHKQAFVYALESIAEFARRRKFSRQKLAEFFDNARQQFGSSVADIASYTQTQVKLASDKSHRVSNSAVDWSHPIYVAIKQAIAASDELATVEAARNILQYKTAGLFDLAKSVQLPERTPYEAMLGKYDSPEHLAELRNLQARATLAELLHADDVVSGYEPGDVINSFNEIAMLNPKSATNVAIMRPLLRKRLSSGTLESFETSQAIQDRMRLQSPSTKG